MASEAAPGWLESLSTGRRCPVARRAINAASHRSAPFSRIHRARMSRVERTNETLRQPLAAYRRCKIHCTPSLATAHSPATANTRSVMAHHRIGKARNGSGGGEGDGVQTGYTPLLQFRRFGGIVAVADNSTFRMLGWLPPSRAFLFFREHPAHLPTKPTKFPRRRGHSLFAVGYTSGVCAAGERARGIFMPP